MSPNFLRGSVIALVALGGCAKDKVEFAGFDNQPQVYIVHRAAKDPFKVDKVAGGASLLSGAFQGAAATYGGMDLELGRTVQQRLDLQDPVVHGKAQIANILRREMRLTSLQVLPEPLNIPILADELGVFARAGNTPSFQKQYPAGVVIEVVTQYWGVADFQLVYRAIATLTDLTEAKSFGPVDCSRLIELGDRKKLQAQVNAKFDAYERVADYTAAVEGLLYPNNGALLKQSLRTAAEECADLMVRRLRQRARF